MSTTATRAISPLSRTSPRSLTLPRPSRVSLATPPPTRPPATFTHLALIHAAIDLDAALNAGGGQVFSLPGGLGLPTALNLAAGQLQGGLGLTSQ